MGHLKSALLSIFLLTQLVCRSQGNYYPPINASALWDTVSPAALGWCTDKIQPLYNYLQEEHTKGFLVLKDGKIVLEKYFGTFTKDSLWYWASAGKTLTAFLVGAAEEDGKLSINDRTSKYLGTGWTSCTPSQEDQITIRHQLTMTSGLDDGVPDNHCTLDTCLVYLAAAGTRWAYHNAVYTLLEKVLENATGLPVNLYTQTRLGNRTGMTGLWWTVDYDNVYFSTVRSMARFGLLIQRNGIWNNDTLMHNTGYFNQMITTSQALNLSYGYLWWLNGKASYMLPTVQYIFPGSYAPNAPADMFSGLGKNGQIVSVSPSKGLVFIRMGNAPTSAGSEIPNQLCDQIWQRLNEIICKPGSVGGEPSKSPLNVFPNPASMFCTIDLPNHHFTVEVYDNIGHCIYGHEATGKMVIDCRSYKEGVYTLRIKYSGNQNYYQRLVILKDRNQH